MRFNNVELLTATDSMPLVSIITPVYNSTQFLLETYASVLAQTFEDWEWILVDDCSPDGSMEFMQTHLTDNRVRIYSNAENHGAGYTRNAAIRHANGRFIAFLDADDVWEADKLECQLQVMQQAGAAISHTAYSFIDEQGNPRSGKVSVTDVLSLRAYMKTTEIGCSTAMIDREKIPNVRFVSSRTREDTLLWISLLGKGHVSVGINKPLLRYRISSTQTTRPSQLLRMVYLTLCIYLKAKNIPIYEKYYYWGRYLINAVYKRLRPAE